MTPNNCRVMAIAALFVIVTVLDGNSFIKSNLTAYMDRVPYPPRSASDAYGKSVSAGGELKVNPSMDLLEKEFLKLQNDFAESQKSSKMVKNIEDVKGTYTKEQIKSMSMEEKMALARKMQEKMGAGVNNESPAVMPAIASLTKTGAEMANFFGTTNYVLKVSQINEKYRPLHDKIDEQQAAALKACPVITEGESSAPDAACVKSKKLDTIDSHIRLESGRLEEIQAVWADFRNRSRQFILRIDFDMARTGYGDLITSPITRQQMETIQMLAFAKIQELYGIMKEAQLSSAKWIAARKNIEGNK
jgi:hypothetical protein